MQRFVTHCSPHFIKRRLSQYYFLNLFDILHVTFCLELSKNYIYICIYIYMGPSSSVGIATDYGLEGPGSNPGGDEIFHRSRPTLGPTQPPVQ